MKKIRALIFSFLFCCSAVLPHHVFAEGKIASGSWHSCIVTSAGGLKCWGSNQIGNLGIGKKKAPEEKNGVYYSNEAIDIPGLSSGVKAVYAKGDKTCIITKTGGVKCWGDNQYGALGAGINPEPGNPEQCPPYPGVTSTPWPCSTKPLDVKGLSTGVVDLSMGQTFACALLSSGKVKCWGENSLGQLGSTVGAVTYGGQTYGGKAQFSPVDVEGLTGVTDIATAAAHTCALLSNGTVKCWGFDSDGELGMGGAITGNSWSFKPVQVKGLSDVKSIAAGGSHTCALLSSGEVKCWGMINLVVPTESCGETQEFATGFEGGSVDSGAVTETKGCAKTSTPITVSGLDGIKSFANSNAYCALHSDGTVLCWGPWGYVPYPVDQIKGESIAEISVGEGYGCALLSSGAAKCWGNNVYNSMGCGIENETTQDEGNFTVKNVQGLP